jgi:glycosyltransferase involved in cell wall biosynthesis
MVRMGETSALVSIVMNCYNSDKYLKEAIDSIYAQSYQNWEIIFWDNCSTDNSALIAKSYDSKLKYFLAKEHAALGKARNLALKEAKGDYIAFLDCDDVYLPDKINIQVATMQANDAVCSYGGWIKIDSKGKELAEYKMSNNYGEVFELLLSKYVVNFQTLMLKSSLLKRENISFDSNLKFSTDHNLVLRIAYNWPVLSISDLLVKYRVHGDSLSNNRKMDKMSDFDYTINFLEKLGAQKKYNNFKYFSSKARLKMLLLDAFDDKNYKYFLQVVIQYLFLITRAFLNKSNINSDF